MLGWGRLTGKIRRDKPMGEGRIKSGGEVGGPLVDDEYLYSVVDVLLEIAEETSKSVPQIALNWLLQRPSVVNVVIGVRNEEQLRDNLGAVGWNLTADQMKRLNDVSHRHPTYPYWHQLGYSVINPPPVEW